MESKGDVCKWAGTCVGGNKRTKCKKEGRKWISKKVLGNEGKQAR